MNLRALILALALGAGLAAAGPAAAQPGSAFGLQFQFPDAPTFEPRGPQLGICKTDYQIRQAIAARGYDNVALNAPNERRVQVRASMGGTTYLINYDFCTDTIIDRRVLR
jgi:hypothetical protein